MTTIVSTQFPTQRLLFFVAQDVDESIRAKVSALISTLATKRTWAIAAPQFVDTVEDTGSRPEDEPVETIGGILEIYSALRDPLPRSVDLQALGDVEQVVQTVQEFSGREGIDFEFELDGTYVGAIVAGQPDRSLSVGLLDEWRRQLGI